MSFDSIQSGDSNVSIALLHYPVYDKNRQVVASAVTNLDLHDIARAARTYGLFRYFVVTPLREQQVLVSRIAQHWQEGWGAGYNPKRKAALELVTIADSLLVAIESLEKHYGKKVKVVATGAKGHSQSISYAKMKTLLQDSNQPYLLLFGTGWGLTDEILSGADHILTPILGAGDYNHLSVRSAVAIILDRLMGQH
jgi:hypothetical protein